MTSAHLSKKLYRLCCGPLLLLSVAALPLAASADIFSFSLAAVTGSAKYEQRDSPQNFTLDIETLGLRGSLNFLDLVHLDAEYATNLDKQGFSVRDNDATVRSDADFDNISLWLRVGIPVPLPIIGVYAMVGLGNLDPKYSNSAVAEPSLNQGRQYGLGLSLDLPGLPLEVLMEYVLRPPHKYDQGTSKAGRAIYSSLNLGVRWNF